MPNKEDLMNTIGERLWSYEPVRERDLPLDLAIDEAGVVTLQGHVPTMTIKEAVLAIVGSVAGVAGVVDQVVADPALEVKIAERLSQSESTKHLEPGAVQVFAQLGEVVLVGDLNEADRKAAVAVAEQTDGVRQVVDRLQR
jgi:osmotically-inducible protein OsmY